MSYHRISDDIEIDSMSSKRPPRPVYRWLPSAAKYGAAFLVGGGIIAGTTYALVRYVQHAIATAQVSSDPQVWVNAAKTRAYDPCYNGCDDCDDVNFAYKACAKTASVTVPGIICNANSMWNWAERYPQECLQAVGEIYRAEALGHAMQHARNRLALVILTVAAGLVGGIVTYVLIGWAASRWERRSPGKVVMFGAMLGLGVGSTSGYPCTGYGKDDAQYFINANQTLYGTVHGWVSDCYDYSYACGQSCTGPSSIGGTTCTPTYCTGTSFDEPPSYYVGAAMGRVQNCGFEPISTLPGNTSIRIANALIERNLWVKVSVNQLNLTQVTDPSIVCLHELD